MKKITAFGLFIFLASCQEPGNSDSRDAKIDSLQTEIEALKRANDTLSDHLMTRTYLTKNYPEYFDSIPEPEKFILNDLQQKPDLMPKEAVLGGTMRFTKVTFINGELLVAEFEDGHVMGKAVYTYGMARSGDLVYSYVGNIEY